MTWQEFTRALSKAGFTAEPADAEGFAYYGPELGQTLAGFYVKKRYQRSRQTSVDVTVWVPLEDIGPDTAADLVGYMDEMGGKNGRNLA